LSTFRLSDWTSDGLDPSGIQKEERTPKNDMDFNNKKDMDLLRLTWDEALDLTKDRSEWRNCSFYSTRKD